MTFREWLTMRLSFGMNDKLLLHGKTFRVNVNKLIESNHPFLDIPIMRMKTYSLPFPYNGQIGLRHNLLIWFGSHGFTPQVRVYSQGPVDPQTQRLLIQTSQQ